MNTMHTMVAAQADLDQGQSLRWRVLIALPPDGLGAQAELMRAWLGRNCGSAGWASTPAGFGGIVNDAIAFYFADPDTARAFVERFSCGYRRAPQAGL